MPSSAMPTRASARPAATYGVGRGARRQAVRPELDHGTDLDDAGRPIPTTPTTGGRQRRTRQRRRRRRPDGRPGQRGPQGHHRRPAILARLRAGDERRPDRPPARPAGQRKRAWRRAAEHRVRLVAIGEVLSGNRWRSRPTWPGHRRQGALRGRQGGRDRRPARGDYYVIRVDDTEIRWRWSREAAEAGTAIALGAPPCWWAARACASCGPETSATPSRWPRATPRRRLHDASRVYRYIGTGPLVTTIRRPASTCRSRTTPRHAGSCDKLRVSTQVAGERWAVVAPDGNSYVSS